jgi:hypothetical protein
MRPVIRRILLALAGIAGGLVLAEFLLRVLPFGPGGWDLHGLHEVRLDRPWIYGLRPGAHGVLSATRGVRYVINADGFRGPAYARPKPPENFRIVVVGDSVSYGFGVEEGETYPVLLEEILAREAAPRRLAVVNLGVGGYNPYLENCSSRTSGSPTGPTWC